MPEAYVPLPDGKTIPVTMQAPANGNAAPINVSNGGNTYNITPANGVTPEEMMATLKRYDAESQRTLLAKVENARRRTG